MPYKKTYLLWLNRTHINSNFSLTWNSIRPPLKKIPKYEAKIERMLLNARKEIGFTVALKSVKKDQMTETKETKKATPEWSWKQRQQVEA